MTSRVVEDCKEKHRAILPRASLPRSSWVRARQTWPVLYTRQADSNVEQTRILPVAAHYAVSPAVTQPGPVQSSGGNTAKLGLEREGDIATLHAHSFGFSCLTNTTFSSLVGSKFLVCSPDLCTEINWFKASESHETSNRFSWQPPGARFHNLKISFHFLPATLIVSWCLTITLASTVIWLWCMGRTLVMIYSVPAESAVGQERQRQQGWCLAGTHGPGRQGDLAIRCQTNTCQR